MTNVATGAFTYAPKSNANGTDSFTFQVNDGKADSNVATVTVTIDPVNDAPVASNGAASVVAGSSTTGALSATDIDSVSLTYQLSPTASKGAAVVTNAGDRCVHLHRQRRRERERQLHVQGERRPAASNVADVTVTIQAARLEGLRGLDGSLSLLEDGRGRSVCTRPTRSIGG